MINILPEGARAIVQREYRLRLAATFLFALSLVSISAAVMLMPAYLLVAVSKQRASSEEGRIASSHMKNDTKDEASLTLASEQVKVLRVYLEAPAPSSLVTSILAAASVEVDIARISYSDANHSALVSGKALSRAALLQFSRTLQKIPGVVSADLPVSDLAKNTDVEFTLTLSIKNP